MFLDLTEAFKFQASNTKLLLKPLNLGQFIVTRTTRRSKGTAAQRTAVIESTGGRGLFDHYGRSPPILSWLRRCRVNDRAGRVRAQRRPLPLSPVTESALYISTLPSHRDRSPREKSDRILGDNEDFIGNVRIA